MRPRRHSYPYQAPECARRIDALLRRVPIDKWEELLASPVRFPLNEAVERCDYEAVRLLLTPFILRAYEFRND